MNFSLRSLLCWFALGTSVLAAAPQTLRLINGTTLVGQTTKEENGKIYFRAELLGDLVIDAANVAPRKSAPPVDTASGPAQPIPLSTARQKITDPNQPVWTRKISASLSYASATFTQGPITPAAPLPPGTPVPTGASLGLPGRQLTKQFSASLSRVTPQNTFSFDGKHVSVDAQPLGSQVNSYSATGVYTYNLNENYFVVSRSTYSEDKVRNIDFSALQIFGIGRTLLDRPATKLEVVSGVVFLKERKHLPTDGPVHTGGGFLETFSHDFRPGLTLEHHLLYRTIFAHSELTMIDGYLGFKGMLTPRLGLTTGVTYTYDRSLGRTLLPNVPLPVYANEKGQISFTSGLEYDF